MSRCKILLVRLLLLCSPLAGGCALTDTSSILANRLTHKSEAADPSADSMGKADIAVATGRLAEENGDAARAMKLYSEAIALNPTNADAHWRQAIAFANLQQMEEANGAFEKAIELNQSNAALYTDYGYHLYLQDRFAAAEQALRTAIRMESGDARAHNNLGLVLAATGREQEALTLFQDAGCSEADARSNLAFAQAMRNDLNKARATYQKVLDIDPSKANSSKALEQLNKVAEQTKQSPVTPVSYSLED